MRMGVALADRTAVLFLGIAAGAAIGYAFANGGEGGAPVPAVVAPPPPASPARTPGAPAAPAAAAVPSIAQECALPFQSHLLSAVAAGKPVTVGVFGDSFGDGVWSALYRLLPAREQFRVIKYSRQSTGFTRYASLNLEEHARQQIDADGPVDVAVISFGANDTQGVYTGGHAAALMSPEWQRAIGERIDGFVRLMRDRGAIVYWMGLPKMRAVRFDADIAAMNEFYARRMAALHVPFIDIRPLTVDAAGDYAAYLPDPATNEPRLMRANDGVHMSMNGYVVVTRGLADRIKTYVAAARTMAGAGAPVAPAPAPVLPPASPLPPAPKPDAPKMKAKVPVRVRTDADAPDTLPDRPRPDRQPTRDKAEAARDKAEPVRDKVEPPKPKPVVVKPRAETTETAKPASERRADPPHERGRDAPTVPAKPVVPSLRLTLPPPEPDTAPHASERNR